MARTKQTAKKGTGGKARRTGPTCAYTPKNVGAPSDSDSDTDSEVDDQLLPCSLQEACTYADIQLDEGITLDVEPATVAALACLDISEGSDWRGIKSVLTDRWAKKVSMAKEKDREDVFVPVAFQDMRKLQLVGLAAGTLMEKDKFMKLVPHVDDGRQRLAYDIPAADLQSIYGYPQGAPDLVLSMLDRGNELYFAQDATWHLQDSHRNNARPWLAVVQHPTLKIVGTDKPLPVPACAVYTQRAVSKGKELRLEWGEDMWAALQQIDLMKQGGANHKLHLQLQHKRMLLDPISDALKRHKVGSSAGSSGIGQMGPGSSYGGGGSSVLGATSSRVLAFDGSSCEWFFTGAGADNNRVSAGGNSSRQPLPRGSSNADAGGLQANPQQEQQQQNGPGDSAEQVEPFRILSDDEVEDMDFDLTPKWDTVSGMYCFHNLPEYVIDEFAGVDIDFVLGLQDEQGDDGGSQQQQQQQGVTVFEYDDSKLTKGDIVTNMSEDLVVVAEVLDLHHPVRWCSSPGQRAYTLLAKRDIKAGEALLDYIGEYKLETNAQSEDKLEEAYVYEINAERLKLFGLNTRGALKRGLLVDNREIGNIGRFICCCWGREPPAPGEPPHQNACARVVWNEDIGAPVVRLFALRDIKQGEEVMVDYTSSYWRPLGQALMIEQQKYARSALLQHEKVDRQLEQAVTQGLLSQQQVHAALAFNPDLEQIKQYKGE